MMKKLFFTLFLFGSSGILNASPQVLVTFGGEKLKSVVSEIAVEAGRENKNPTMETAVVAIRLQENHNLQGDIPVIIQYGDKVDEVVYALLKGQDSVILISAYPKDLKYIIFKIGQIVESGPGMSVSDSESN